MYLQLFYYIYNSQTFFYNTGDYLMHICLICTNTEVNISGLILVIKNVQDLMLK